MNECLNCGKLVKNKYCNVSCQNKHQNSIKSDKIFGEYKKFIVVCNKCNIEFEVEEREKLYPQKEKYYCSRSCANSRNWNDNDKEKKSKSLKNKFSENRILKTLITKCKNCNKEIEHPIYKKRVFCSHSCNTKYYNNTTNKAKLAGLKSCNIQKETRRSKNEIYFSQLCENYFKNILLNEQIFNGWDADVIIQDYKIAVLWNGKWHYEKITKKHSVEQVQNREELKIKEIIKMGYEPYIIKDMGRYNKEFVEIEFEKIKKYCGVEQW
jgi:hypothetical protein